MTDDLDTKTDAQISEIFASEVASWSDIDIRRYRGTEHISRFATDANAVLLWLERYSHVEARRLDGQWRVTIVTYYGHGIVTKHYADSHSFARAACIALIRAKRSERSSK